MLRVTRRARLDVHDLEQAVAGQVVAAVRFYAKLGD